MFCNALLQECTRHNRTPLLTDLEDIREADFRGLASLTRAVTWTQECVVGERA
jgi:hypothetical protein